MMKTWLKIVLIVLALIIAFVVLLSTGKTNLIKGLFAPIAFTPNPSAVSIYNTQIVAYTLEAQNPETATPASYWQKRTVVTPTPSLTPTKTPTPTKTSTPIPTPTCQFSLTKYGLAFLFYDIVQLSFFTPIDLTPYKIVNEQGVLTSELSLQGFKISKNGQPYEEYSIHVWDPALPNLLYVQVNAGKDDVFEIEFSHANQRYCSEPLTIPASN